MAIQRTSNDLPSTQEQSRVVRCVRFVYNYMLRLCADTWYGRQTRIGYLETRTALKVIKGLRQYEFLTMVPAAPLDRALRELDSDFQSFYAGRSPYPRFKTGHDMPVGAYAALPAVTAVSKLTVRIEYPTMTRCADCGYFLESAPVTVEWICPECGVIQIAAINAARNAEAVRRSLEANGEG